MEERDQNQQREKNATKKKKTQNNPIHYANRSSINRHNILEK